MKKRNLKTKAAKGKTKADVANDAVRNLLSMISEKIGKITEEELKRTLEYFDYKCPYTGEDLPFSDFDKATDEQKKLFTEGFEADHIIPQNTDKCGLNIYGNLVYVTKEANGEKNRKDYDAFIRECKNVKGLDETVSSEIREERINKIKRFLDESKYNILTENIDTIMAFLNNVYDDVKKQQEGRLLSLEKLFGDKIDEYKKAKAKQTSE